MRDDSIRGGISIHHSKIGSPAAKNAVKLAAAPSRGRGRGGTGTLAAAKKKAASPADGGTGKRGRPPNKTVPKAKESNTD
ncbi:hypothetical protein niasHT_033776 [Heterodera trifolii]|uniref:Uncharacterized protein n=1 Tax=Heterodera trifolii TaxID=157864 RepID=A0ABD2IC22_9BILA